MDNSTDRGNSISKFDIAIVGMASRFPGARNIGEFWRDLCDGVESISFFTDEELKAAGEDPSVLRDPCYVKARGILEDVELFDASFFGFYPREAQMMDPQHRLFLECAWEALEDAGYDTENYQGIVGVFGGAGINSYLLSIISSNPGSLSLAEGYQLAIGNHHDFLTTRVSYKLNLKGPSIDLQTACSTSLVAVHMACRSLLGYQCDMALAGGVTIGLPQKKGYLFHEGMILSPDGHCRAFDAKAQGTVAGNGAGMVVLKRLADAVVDGDHVYAVIKGSAVNNDGAMRVGFTAPSVDGQAEVIATAQALAGVEPETISYVEAHGTGTPLGDPIEVAALTQVFQEQTDAKGFCAIGSVKTNVGHLDTAAGVAGLIKTALALNHRVIPPSLNFKRPNPKIDFQNSPFYVNTKLSEWKAGPTPRRAGVSSFGIGGTNAHVVLEEAPAIESPGTSRPWHLLVLSAKTDSALEAATSNLATHLKQHPELNLADVAYTLQVGRKAFNHRRIVVCRTLEDAWDALEKRDPKRIFSTCHLQEPGDRSVAFMFSGQGAQYVDMGRELYQIEPAFRELVDYCSEFLKPHLDLDLRELLYPPKENVGKAAEQLNQTYITQPALFVIEYALAKLWMAWGIYPQAMVGHSIGEYVAACLSGVFSLADALILVAARGRMMQEMPSGAMLSVPLEEREVRPLLGEKLSLAAINGPSSCVVSGPHDAIAELEQKLTKKAVEYRRLHTSHAFHSEMMDPILEAFAKEVEKVSLRSPKIPYISNVTGTWITAEEATDPSYYARHLRHTVKFAEGIRELLIEPNRILLEAGPGQTLSTLARRHSNSAPGSVVLNSMRHPDERHSDLALLLSTLGKLWLAGVKVDWSGFYTKERRLRVPLPTYPFERQRYWLDMKEAAPTRGVSQSEWHKKPEVADWFYVPSWKRSDLSRPCRANGSAGEKTSWLLFVDDYGLGSRVAERLEDNGHDVITVRAGKQFKRVNEHTFTLNPQAREDYDALLTELGELKGVPRRIVHFWSVTPDDQVKSDSEFFENAQALGFYSLLFLAQALGRENITDPLQLWVVSTNLQEVTGEELLCPEKATLLGPCKVIPQEYPNITCHSLDVTIPDSGISIGESLINQLIIEFTAKTPAGSITAYRGNHRWVQIYEAMPSDEYGEGSTRLRQGGVYLITGGLGRIGLTLAEYLAQTVQAKLILIGRSTLPVRNEWDQWLEAHDEQDSISRKIRKLIAIEEMGGEVLVFSADVADEQQMQEIITQAYDRFGRIHGVIHAAGAVGEKSVRTIQEMSLLEPELQFQAKIYGLPVLAKILQGKKLDFCLLQSSLSSILGGLGFVAYSAANLYMDAFAHKHNRANDGPWISVNWDGWQFDEEKEQGTGIGATMAELVITSSEGIEAFRRILSRDNLNQTIVSTGDLQSRLGRWIKREPMREKETAVRSNSPASLLSRPNLQTIYVAASNELEQRIAEIWQKLLGLEPVGIFDNFFDLGGNSLLGTQLVAQLRSAFQVEFPLRNLFENPTVAGVAEIIEAATKERQGTVDKIAEALKKVEELSEEEAKALLDEMQVSK
jgi:acyl transferase domain-containing protein